MKKLILILCSLAMFCSFPLTAFAPTGGMSTGLPTGRAKPQVSEVDGSDSGYYWKLIFDNDSLTDNSNGTVTHSIAGFADGRYLKLDQTTPQTVSSGAPIFGASLDLSAVASDEEVLFMNGTTVDGHSGLTYDPDFTSLKIAGAGTLQFNDANSYIYNGGGQLRLVDDEVIWLDTPLIKILDGDQLGNLAGPLLTFDDTNNYLEVTGCNVGIGTATPSYPLVIEADSDDTRILFLDQETNDYTGAAQNIALDIDKTVSSITIPETFITYGIRNNLTNSSVVSGTLEGGDKTLQNYGFVSDVLADGAHSAATEGGTFKEENRGGSFSVGRTGILTTDSIMIENKGVSLAVIDSISYNSSGGTCDVNNYAFKAVINQSGTETAGTLTKKNYGVYSTISGNTEGATTNYGLYTAVSGADTNYGLYSASDVPSYFAGNVGIGVSDPDTKLEIFNAGDQLKLSYDATNYFKFATQSDGDLTLDSNKASYTLDFGDGLLTTTGTLGAGAATVTSLDAGSGTIETTGAITDGTFSVDAGVMTGIASLDGAGTINLEDNLDGTGFDVTADGLILNDPTNNDDVTHEVSAHGSASGGTIGWTLFGSNEIWINKWEGHIIGLDQDLRHDTPSVTFNKYIALMSGSVFKDLILDADLGTGHPTGAWRLDVVADDLGTGGAGMGGVDGKGVYLECEDGQDAIYAGAAGDGGSVKIKIGAKGVGTLGASDGVDGVMSITGGDVGIGVTDPHSLLEVAGAISSATDTITASSDTTDVSGINTLFIAPASANVVIGGFTGGVEGQVLYIAITGIAFTTTVENQEGIVGSQDIYLCDETDDTLNDYGGWTLVCNGTNWYDLSHAKHVE